MKTINEVRLFACANFVGEEEEFEGDPMAEFCSECNQCQACHEGTPDLEECEECHAEACARCMVNNIKRICVGCYNGRED
jgi:hypothetical protein